MACNGLKKGSFHLFRQPRWFRIVLEKSIFDQFFTLFFVPNQPISNPNLRF